MTPFTRVKRWTNDENMTAYAVDQEISNVLTQLNNIFLSLPIQISTGTAAPTTGYWNLGDIVFNSNPTSGGYVGFVCITAGTPGTWKTFGAIS